MKDVFQQLAEQRAANAKKARAGAISRHDDTAEKDKKVKATAPTIETGLDTAKLAHRRQSQHYTLNAAGIEAATKQIRELPAPGWSVHCIMGGLYHGFDIIPTIYRLAGEPIKRLTIATLSFSKRNLANLAYMLDEKMVAEVELLTSDYFAKADADIYTAARAELEQRGQRIGFTRNHAKVICLDFPTAGAFTVETSANLRSCVNFEQFALHNDAGLMEYHRGWITQLLDKHDSEPQTEED